MSSGFVYPNKHVDILGTAADSLHHYWKLKQIAGFHSGLCSHLFNRQVNIEASEKNKVLLCTIQCNVFFVFFLQCIQYNMNIPAFKHEKDSHFTFS